jgi:hypothetical protein
MNGSPTRVNQYPFFSCAASVLDRSDADLSVVKGFLPGSKIYVLPSAKISTPKLLAIGLVDAGIHGPYPKFIWAGTLTELYAALQREDCLGEITLTTF